MTGQQLLERLNASDDPDQFVEDLDFDDVVRLYEHASGYSACVDEWLDDDYPDKIADLQTKILNLRESRPPETLESVAASLIDRLETNNGGLPLGTISQRGWAQRLRDALGLRHKEIGEPKPGDPDFAEPGEAVEAKPIDYGGSAFPSEQHECQDNTWNQTFDSGMSLRHWFAGRAPQMPREIFQLVADHIDINNPNKTHGEKCQALFDIVTEWRYMYADAMIEAGKKGGTS